MRMVVARADVGAGAGGPHATPERRWRRQLSAPLSPDESLATLNTLIGQALSEDTVSEGQPGAISVALWDDVDTARGVVRGMRHASTS